MKEEKQREFLTLFAELIPKKGIRELTDIYQNIFDLADAYALEMCNEMVEDMNARYIADDVDLWQFIPSQLTQENGNGE